MGDLLNITFTVFFVNTFLVLFFRKLLVSISNKYIIKKQFARQLFLIQLYLFFNLPFVFRHIHLKTKKPIPLYERAFFKFLYSLKKRK
ncbi:hypothetical protein B379_05415 [Anoxybacillus ayderensis G10]|nr:hypothetical protein B379_05415 [Anoxybacillus ayderensis G10]